MEFFWNEFYYDPEESICSPNQILVKITRSDGKVQKRYCRGNTASVIGLNDCGEACDPFVVDCATRKVSVDDTKFTNVDKSIYVSTYTFEITGGIYESAAEGFTWPSTKQTFTFVLGAERSNKCFFSDKTHLLQLTYATTPAYLPASFDLGAIDTSTFTKPVQVVKNATTFVNYDDCEMYLSIKDTQSGLQLNSLGQVTENRKIEFTWPSDWPDGSHSLEVKVVISHKDEELEDESLPFIIESHNCGIRYRDLSFDGMKQDSTFLSPIPAKNINIPNIIETIFVFDQRTSNYCKDDSKTKVRLIQTSKGEEWGNSSKMFLPRIAHKQRSYDGFEGNVSTIKANLSNYEGRYEGKMYRSEKNQKADRDLHFEFVYCVVSEPAADFVQASSNDLFIDLDEIADDFQLSVPLKPVSVTAEPECGHMIYAASSSHSEEASFDVFALNKATITLDEAGELMLDFFDFKTYISGTLTVTVTMRQSIAPETVFTRKFEIIFLNCLTEKLTQTIGSGSAQNGAKFSHRFGVQFNEKVRFMETYRFQTVLANQYCTIAEYRITCEHTHTQVYESSSP